MICRYNLILILLAQIILGMSAPRISAAETPTRPLRIGLDLELGSRDPYQDWSHVSESVFMTVYDSLVELDGDGEITPRLARSWQQVDELTYRFLLRPAEFHDGHQLSSRDVVFSFNRLKNLETSELSSLLATLADVRAIDQSTVELRTKVVDPLFLKKLCSLAIIPENAPMPIEHPIGTGVYRWLDGDHELIRLEAVTESYKGRPLEPQVEFLLVRDRAKRLDLLLSGEADLISLDASDVDAVEERGDLWVFSRLTSWTFYLAFNMEHPVTGDIRVRRAIDLAIDRSRIVEEIFLGHARPSAQLAGPDSVGFQPSLHPKGADLPASRRLLAQVAGKQPLKVTILGLRPAVLEMIAAQLGEAGLVVEVRSVDWTTFQAEVDSDDIGVYLMGWVDTALDICDVYENLVHTRQPKKGLGSWNRGRFSEPEVDGWVEACGSTSDEVRRQALMDKIWARVDSLKPVLPLVWRMNLYAGARDLEFDPRLDGRMIPSDIRRRRE